MEKDNKREDGELRRWVSNLQLESWQLELLITGFSIFLLATSLQEYDEFRLNFVFHKLSGNSRDIFLTVPFGLILSAIPHALQFFLVSLLVHLLLRGFWIGIVGLSSVSNKIEFSKINLKKPFNKYLEANVKTLDELILFIDRISSVIFAYTYLIVFSILSVVIVAAFLFAFFSLTTFVQDLWGASKLLVGILNMVIILTWVTLLAGAIIFFLDTILFSAFKKSKWFSVLYYPIYRFYSIVSFSFLYRSIYYHLITNFKKKFILTAAGSLLLLTVIVDKVNSWNVHTFFPEVDPAVPSMVMSVNYDDQRSAGSYIRNASIPSKYVSGNYLELFINYHADLNMALEILCPDSENIKMYDSFMDGVNAGIQSAYDSTRTYKELMQPMDQYNQRVSEAIACISKAYEVLIDGRPVEGLNFLFTRHPNKGERGFLVMIEVDDLDKGQHVLHLNRLENKNRGLWSKNTLEDYKMENFSRILFWK